MTLKRGAAIAVLTVTVLFGAPIVPVSAADKWIEVKSPHVTVVSSTNASSSRKMAWQVEQIRSAITKLWLWARVDLDKPLVVFAVDDEQGMRALVPEYWERRGTVHPASVWVTGVDHYYLAIRADVETEDRDLLNPYQTAYFSYASLVLHRSIQTNLPEWLSRGLSGVMSNTIVRDNQLLVGPPIPWHLKSLREGPRYKLGALLKITRRSPELKSDQGLSRFDAQAWALVHFLMFADNAARKPKLDQFFRLVASGTDSDVAFRQALGSVEALESDFPLYVNRSIFSFGRLEVDASVKRESFPQRPLSPTEVGSNLALLHVAMGRPVEARAAIAQVRKTEASSPETFVAEGILLDRENKRDEARDASRVRSMAARRAPTRTIGLRICAGRRTPIATRWPVSKSSWRARSR